MELRVDWLTLPRPCVRGIGGSRRSLSAIPTVCGSGLMATPARRGMSRMQVSRRKARHTTCLPLVGWRWARMVSLIRRRRSMASDTTAPAGRTASSSMVAVLGTASMASARRAAWPYNAPAGRRLVHHYCGGGRAARHRRARRKLWPGRCSNDHTSHRSSRRHRGPGLRSEPKGTRRSRCPTCGKWLGNPRAAVHGKARTACEVMSLRQPGIAYPLPAPR